MTLERFVMQEVANRVEDATVINSVTVTDQLVSQALCQMAFAHARRSHDDHVTMLAYEVAAGQVEDLFPLDRLVELPVKVLQ